jgi:hypothetical protein
MHHFLFEEAHGRWYADCCRISPIEGTQSSFRVAVFDELCKTDRTTIYLLISCISPH